MRRIFTAAVIGGMMLAPAMAQDAFVVIPKSGQTLKPGPGGIYNVMPLLNRKTSQSNVTMRAKTGQGEMHADWEDHIFILEGEANLILGGTIVNGKTVSAGETRGDGIKDGKTFSLHPGDYIFVPVKTPHQMVLAAGKSIRYGVVKTRP